MVDFVPVIAAFCDERDALKASYAALESLCKTMGETMHALALEKDALKADLEAAHKRIEAERAGCESVLAVLDAAVPSHIAEAIEILRQNMRDPDRSVINVGIRDNDATRAAIDVLLSAAPTLPSAVPDGWVSVTKELLNSQPPWLYGDLLITNGADVYIAKYEWRQGRDPHRFDVHGNGEWNALGGFWAMPFVRPAPPVVEVLSE